MAKPRVRKNRLTNLSVDEVSLVDRPANPSAVVLLAKRADDKGQEITDGSEGEEVTKDGNDDGTTDETVCADCGGTVSDGECDDCGAQVSKAAGGDEPAESPLNIYTDALNESIASILADESVVEKGAMIQKSIEQFSAAVLAKAGVADSSTTTITTSGEAHMPAENEVTLLKGLSPEQSESVTKAIAPMLVRIEKAESENAALKAKIAKAERVEKVKAMVGAAPVDLAVIEKALEDSNDSPAVEAALVAVIAKAAEGAKALFAEVGTSAVAKSGDTPETLLAALAVDIRKAAPTLSEAEAYSKALDQRPDLYDALTR